MPANDGAAADGRTPGAGLGAAERAPEGNADRSAPSTGAGAAGMDYARLLRGAGSLAGQTTLIATLLFYFGWARTQAEFRYFGLDPALAQFSVIDYLLRSVAVTVKLLVVLGLVALVLAMAHRYVVQNLVNSRAVVLACVTCGLVALLLGIIGFRNWVVYSTTYPIVPILLGLGATLIGYGFHLRELAHRNSPDDQLRDGTQVAIVTILDLVLLLWSISVYANISGQQAGAALASNLGTQPSVVLYSENSLAITTRGVQFGQLRGAGNQYRYRYSNLKLLLYSNGEYFLLPDNWRKGKDPVLLIGASDTVRFEFYSGSG